MLLSVNAVAYDDSPAEKSLLPLVFVSLLVHIVVFVGIPLLTKIVYKSERYERPRTFQLVSTSLVKPVAVQSVKSSAAVKKNATTPVPAKNRNSNEARDKQVKENTDDLSELLDAVKSVPVSDIVPAQNFKYHWYIQNLVSKVEEQWKPPMGLTDRTDAAVEVSFIIFQNGSISGVNVSKSSGISTLDNLAVRAITLAAPFGKLPIGFTENRLDISYTLHYTK
jgi:TonB family protein